MGTSSRGNRNVSKNEGIIDFPNSQESISTRGQIYKRAVRHYQDCFPHLSGTESVASITAIGYKKLTAAMRDECELWSSDQDRLFDKCLYPQGYDELKQLNFPNSMPTYSNLKKNMELK